MPIKNLTDQQAAFPQIGVLRKGAAKQGNRPGRDLTYFRFTSEHSDVIATFQRAYGDQPQDVNIFLPYRTTDENFTAWQEQWVAGGLVHRCNGETTTILRQKDGTYTTEPKPCPGDCKPVGRLAIIIPELKRLAYVMALTTSKNDIIQLTRNLQALEMLNGDLRGIPLVLRRRPCMVSTPRPDGNRVRSEKWLLTLEAAPNWVALQLAAQEAAAIPRLADGSLPELMAPDDDENGVVIDAETGEIIDTSSAHYDGPDWDNAPPDEPPAPPPQPQRQNGHGRPLDADTVRHTIRKKAGWHHGDEADYSDAHRLDSEPITTGQVGAVGGLLSDALGAVDKDIERQSRHEVLNYLAGVTSTTQLTKREASAIITWLKEPGDEWTINQYAQSEVAAVLNAAGVEAGQLAMDLEES